MSALVYFSTGSGRWAVEVGWTRRVVPAAQITPLPAPRPGVIGLIATEPGAEPIPVVDALGSPAGESAHVIELDAGGRRFGLLAGRVTAVLGDGGAAVGPPPAGQEDPVVAGIVHLDDGGALLIDPLALARRVEPRPEISR